MTTVDVTRRVHQLTAARRPFVHATVVRAQKPSSARAGDSAVILDDGSIEGFVGGQCAEGSVRSAALGALHDGRPVLLRVLPDGDPAFPETPDARVVVNPCHSGGAIEIFLRPVLPAPVLDVVGTTPIGDAVAAVAALLGFEVRHPAPPDGHAGATVVVVATLGGAEQDTVRAALDAGVGLVALVASRRRGHRLLDAMALDADQRARVRSPAGLDIGARTPPEIALSILAEVVRAVRMDGLTAAQPPDGEPAGPPREAVDPVCGMTVLVGPDTPYAHADGRDHYFCCAGCRTSFAERAGVP